LVCSLPGKIPHKEKLCGSFWWRDVLKQVDNFREVAAGRGDTALFWNDNWSIDGSTQPMSTRFSRFFPFALTDKVSVVQVYDSDDLLSLFLSANTHTCFSGVS
jgi:hypothetical protein